MAASGNCVVVALLVASLAVSTLAVDLGGLRIKVRLNYTPNKGQVTGCRYWCRTPERQYYCCEGGEEPPVYPSVKPGRCPPVRPQCPRVGSFRPPTTCSNDSKCPGSEKCCFDRCLEHHTCKPPRGYF